MRNTRQKNLILSIINESNEHLSAYQIYELSKKTIPNISLGTVYRNLSQLVDNGMIRKLIIDGVDRFDKKIRHSHFICDKCGSVIDVFENYFEDTDYIGDNLVMDYEINFKGFCQKCLKEEKKYGIKGK